MYGVADKLKRAKPSRENIQYYHELELITPKNHQEICQKHATIKGIYKMFGI